MIFHVQSFLLEREAGQISVCNVVHSTPRWSCEDKDVRTRVGHGWMLNRVLILAAHLKRRFYR